jgi:peptide/nickel transport system substrate-binding protein
MMNAIYGGLFQLVADEDGGNPRIVGVLARDYEIRDDGRTIAILLREGVRFSDGTPFNAEAVRFNIERNLTSPCTCAPNDWPWAERDRVTTAGENVVELHFSRPYGPVMNAFPTANVNWIASPAALSKMGEDHFKITPVGAGPFRVVSNDLSTRLVLERNPRYWQPERPYLDRLIFQSIGTEQAAFHALLAGDAQAFEGMTSITLIQQAKERGLTVTQQPATAAYMIQLNTLRAPFDDHRVREAIYHATNVDAIQQGLFDTSYPLTQSFTGPGGLFHRQAVPGYRGYDPERAKSIVEQIAPIRIKLGTIRSLVAEQIVTALQTQWSNAGMNVAIETHEIATMIREFQSGEWQAMLQVAGSYDPESSVSFRFRSDQPNTGVRDPALDDLLSAATATFDQDKRASLYLEAAKYISDNAYAPFLFAFAPANVTTQGLDGSGLTTKIPPIMMSTGVLWHDVRYRTP